MSKQSRWLLVCVGIVVVLGGALVWQRFHQQIISGLGGGVASISPLGGGQHTAAWSAPAPASSASPAASPVPQPQAASPLNATFLFATGRVVSCAKDLLVLSRGDGGRLSFEIKEDGQAECVRNIGRVVRVEYTQIGARKIADRIITPVETQRKAGASRVR